MPQRVAKWAERDLWLSVLGAQLHSPPLLNLLETFKSECMRRRYHT